MSKHKRNRSKFIDEFLVTSDCMTGRTVLNFSHVAQLLEKINQFQEDLFAPLKRLGRTLRSWQEKVARMFRYTQITASLRAFIEK